MPKLSNKVPKLFANNGVKRQFGSTKNNLPVDAANDPAIIDALSNFLDGYAECIVTTNDNKKVAPYTEYINALFFYCCYHILLAKEQGLMEYAASMTYYINSVVKDPVTTHLYISKIDNNANQLLTNTAAWNKIGDLALLNSRQNFNYTCSVSGLTQVIAPNTTYQLLTAILESSGVLRLNTGFELKTLAGATFTKFLDEVNNKFVFPSNVQSTALQYCDYDIRVVLNGTFSGAADTDAEYKVRLRRVIDNSIVATLTLIKTRTTTLDAGTLVFQTFVFSEADPFVLNGCYIDIFSPTDNTINLTLTDISITIFGRF